MGFIQGSFIYPIYKTIITENGKGYVFDRFGNKKFTGGSVYQKLFPNANEIDFISQIQYYSTMDYENGKGQPYIPYKNKKYRARCEIIVIKDNQILLDPEKNRGGFGYALPGGGIDPKERIAHCAKRECEEEALILPKQVKYMNVAWTEEFHSPKMFDGAISFTCVGTYERQFKGNVKEEDRDEFADRAVWIDINKVDLGEPHRLALIRYQTGKIK